jgi:diguanylate cyclase (GGDEF)-like protein/PAS domain S-box-containing protein
MPLQELLSENFSLTDAIDPSPLKISPDLPLTEVITLMGQVRSSCLLGEKTGTLLDSTAIQEARASCVFVCQNDRLLGLITERDLIRLAAKGIPPDQVPIADVMTRDLVTTTVNDIRSAFSVVSLFRQHHIRHLPVLNEEKQLIGVITPESLCSSLQLSDLFRLRKVGEVMTREVIHAFPSDTVLVLAGCMADYRVSCVVITESGAQNTLIPVGIVTERDIVQFQALGLSGYQVKAEEIMSSPPWSLKPTAHLWQAHQEMQKRRVQRLVICSDAGTLLGIVTQTSLLQALDPMELYGVVQTLRQEIYHLQADRIERLARSNSELSEQVQQAKSDRKKVQLDLQREQEFNSAVLDIITKPIIILNVEGQIIRFNRGCELATGYTAQDVQHQLIWETLLIEEEIEPVKAFFRDLKVGIYPSTYENHWLTKSGEKRLFAWSNTVLSNADGKVKYIIATGQDVTEQRQAAIALRQSEEAYRHLAAELEQRVAKRTQELQRTNEHLRQEIAERLQTEEALQRANQNLAQVNQRLEQSVNELAQRNLDLGIISDMIEFLQACHSTEEACTAASEFLKLLFMDCGGEVLLCSPDRQLMEAVAIFGNLKSEETIFEFDDCWALRRSQIHLATQAKPGLFCKHIGQDSHPTASLCLPMISQGEVFGLLHVQTQLPEGLSPVRQQLARTVTEQMSLALANLKLRETLRSESIRDALTGLFNRRYLEESLNREIRRAECQQQPLSIIMVDIDHFKQFNDTFGHEAGDTVLRSLGQFLGQQVRGSDIACRFGGEELTLILPNASLEVAATRAEQLRQGVSHLQLYYQDQSLSTITISLGVACFPEHGQEGELLLRRADEALYQAKRQGRNCVVAAS